MIVGKLTDKDYLALCIMLSEMKDSEKKALSATVKGLGFHSAVSTILFRNELVKCVKIKGSAKNSWKWVGIKPNILMAQKLKSEVKNYWKKHEVKGKVILEKKPTFTPTTNANMNENKDAFQEPTQLKPTMRPVRKLALSKDFKIGFALASLISKLDVLPSVEELQSIIESAQTLKKDTF